MICHVFASQLSGHCDVIADWLWRHQQNIKRASETRGLCVKILVLASFMDSLCRVRNEIMYVLLWRTVYALTQVLFWCLFPSSVILVFIINTKITLSWAHKQFATRVHTLFSMSELTMALFTRIYWSLALMNYSISQEICTRFCCALLCCGYAIVHNEFTWSMYPYSSGLLCWHWGNR